MNSLNRSQHAWVNFDDFLKEIIKEDEIKLLIKLKVSARDTARFCVTHNQTMIYDNHLLPGVHQINLTYLSDSNNELKLGMFGKDPVHDTVSEDGKIVADKFIELLELKINNFDLFKDYDVYYNHLKYWNHDQNQYTDVHSGFWFNSELIIDYGSSFINWYTSKTSKNTQVAENMIHQTRSAEEFNKMEKILCERLEQLKK